MGNWVCFDDFNQIIGFCRVIFIVGVIFFGMNYYFVVYGVFDFVFDEDGDCFFYFVVDNLIDQSMFVIGGFVYCCIVFLWISVWM